MKANEGGRKDGLGKTKYPCQSKVAKGQGMKRGCVKQVDAVFRGARLR